MFNSSWSLYKTPISSLSCPCIRFSVPLCRSPAGILGHISGELSRGLSVPSTGVGLSGICSVPGTVLGTGGQNKANNSAQILHPLSSAYLFMESQQCL